MGRQAEEVAREEAEKQMRDEEEAHPLKDEMNPRKRGFRV